MNMGYMGYYLIAVNVAGILLVVIKTWLHTDISRRRLDAAFAVLSLAGGALGVLAAVLLLDRKADKNNMMSRVIIICAAIIQIVIILMVRGFHRDQLTFAFWDFLCAHKMLCVYLIIINIITFAAFGVDKMNAVRHRFRIRIVTLLVLAFAGGSVGGLAGMYVFRHKTRKDYFAVGIPLIIVMQAAVIFCLMNLK